MTAIEGSTTHISNSDITFEQTLSTPDVIDFVSHLGPNFMSSRKLRPRLSSDVDEMTRRRDGLKARYERAVNVLACKSEQIDRIMSILVMRSEKLGHDLIADEKRRRADTLACALLMRLRSFTHAVEAELHDYQAAQTDLDTLTAGK